MKSQMKVLSSLEELTDEESLDFCVYNSKHSCQFQPYTIYTILTHQFPRDVIVLEFIFEFFYSASVKCNFVYCVTLYENSMTMCETFICEKFR